MQKNFKEKRKICIVTVNLNEEKDTEACINSLLEQTYKSRDIIIVDNGSEQKSYNYLKAKFPSMNIIGLKENIGFAGGYNKGIEYAKKNGYKLVAIINNDAIADKDWLMRLVENLNSETKIGITGGKTLFYNDKLIIQTAGKKYLKLRAVYLDRGFKEVDDRGLYNKIEAVDALSGVGMLINLEMPEIYFDQKLFAYYEDIDLCERVKKNGYKILYVPDAKIYHKVSLTANKMSGLQVYYGTRNRLIILRRYHGLLTFIFAYIRSIIKAILNLFTFDKVVIQNYLKALIDL